RGDAAGAERHAAGVLGAIEAEVIELPDVLGLTTGRTDVLAVARLTKGSALLLQGRWPEARAHLDVPEEAHPMWQILATGALALLEAWCGRFRLAEELSRRALALASQVPVAQQA